jgi:hypothetical protein
MRKLSILVAAALLPLAAQAEDLAAAAATEATDPATEATGATGTPDAPFQGGEVTLEQFLWTARPVVVFADTPADPSFQRQMDLLRQRPEALAERDVVVIVDTDPAARSGLRLKLRPRGFMLVIISKDGQVAIRKPSPWDVREISRTIDKMPLRQQEIRDRGLSGR